MNIVFIGPPGAGKGTHVNVLKNRLEIPSISTGDIVRQTLKGDSLLTRQLRYYSGKGLLVPDDIIINMIKDKLSDENCSKGFILDGFPRTLVQAKSLENANVNVDLVLNIEADDDLIYSRITGRRVCPECGSVYNISTEMKPKKEGTCDVCGKNLIKREDDSLEIMKQRLKVYRDQTVSLVDFYKNKNKLVSFDGADSFDKVSKGILRVVLKK